MFGDDRHRNDLKHECELVIDEDVTYGHIDHGSCVGLRRWFRKMMLIDELNPCARALYKSTFIINREKMYHLKNHYFMIHPYSNFREVWELIQSVSIIIHLSTTPLRIMLQDNAANYVACIADLFTLADIIVSFHTGYFNRQSTCIVMHQRSIAVNYMMTTFILDIASFINLHYFELFINGTWQIKYQHGYKYLEFINVANWSRFAVLWIYLNRLKHSRQINIYAMGVIKVVLAMFLLVLWMSALTYVSSFDPNHLENSHNLFEAVRRGFHMLFLYGPSVYPDDTGVLLSQMICLLVGFILYLLIIRQMMQAGTKYNSIRKYNQSVKQVTDYMRHKSLPPGLQTKILRYYDFRYEMNFYKEEQIISILGPQLLREVMLQAHMHFFAKFPLFEIIPIHVLFGIIMSMEMRCYMPSDNIIIAGTKPAAMFFIKTGSVAVYTIAGKELKHMAEGEHFAELALMGDTRQQSETIIAIDCCEIYILKRSEFMAQIKLYPDVFSKVNMYMHNYILEYYHEDVDMYQET